MQQLKLSALTILALLAFAANSVLCRLALDAEQMDAANFTGIRLISAAITLSILVLLSNTHKTTELLTFGSWKAALYLFVYATGFSFAYISLPTAAGALVLFATVQFSMLGIAWYGGKRLTPTEIIGVLLSLLGLVYFLLPEVRSVNFSSSDLAGLFFMLLAGIAWALYTIAGKTSVNALQDTAANFVRLLPLAMLIFFFANPISSLSTQGIAYAIGSGALASGVGYAIWYQALPLLNPSLAAVSQLSVPILAALGGLLLVNEPIDSHLVASGSIILSGILLVILARRAKPAV
ncbi:MAG: drug/metabolite transporter (DMT)-like permease [Paraglaciecola sp.]